MHPRHSAFNWFVFLICWKKANLFPCSTFQPTNMVGIWSKKSHFAAVLLAPLRDRTRAGYKDMRQEHILQATQFSLHIVYGSLKPPQKSVFASALRKSKNTCPLRSANEKPNRTDSMHPRHSAFNWFAFLICWKKRISFLVLHSNLQTW